MSSQNDQDRIIVEFEDELRASLVDQETYLPIDFDANFGEPTLAKFLPA